MMWVLFFLIIAISFNLLKAEIPYANEYDFETENIPSFSKAFEEPSQISFLSLELTDETFFLLAYKLVAIQIAASNLILQTRTTKVFQWPLPSKTLVALSKLLQERKRGDIECEIKEVQNVLKLMITSKPSDIRRMSAKNFGEKVDLDMVAFSKWLVDNRHFKVEGIKTADAYLIVYYLLKFYKPLLLPSKNGWKSEVMNRLLGDIKKEVEKHIFLTDNFEELYRKFDKDTKKTSKNILLMLTLTIVLLVISTIIWSKARTQK